MLYHVFVCILFLLFNSIVYLHLLIIFVGYENEYKTYVRYIQMKKIHLGYFVIFIKPTVNKIMKKKKEAKIELQFLIANDVVFY